MRRIVTLVPILVMMLAGCPHAAETPSPYLHAFYYPWYGTPEADGVYIHWRHDVLGDGPQHTYPGGENIGADFYPEGGCYSSGDPAVLHRHMLQLREASIGVICVSWLGPDCLEARALDTLMDIAAAHGVMVNFHLEPAVQTSVETIRGAIVHLITTYGEHPAFYRDPAVADRGLFYVYDSHDTPAAEWTRLLTPEGDLTIRGTRWDTAVLGLVLAESDLGFIENAGMDGGYAYFAVDGFSFGSTSANWSRLVNWARERGLLFVPSVGPGYRDLRIRPWNRRNQRERDGGQYYDCMFARAIAADPPIIGITSFNEWHEGTQIEPAVSYATDSFTYLDYSPLSPEAYLKSTSAWSSRWQQFRAGSWLPDENEDGPCGGGVASTSVVHAAIGRPLKLDQKYSTSYTAGGDGALLDGVTGSTSYRDGCWQGYEGVDLQVEIDLGVSDRVAGLRLGFLQDQLAWIFLPRRILVAGSADGTTYTSLATVVAVSSADAVDPLRYEETVELKDRHLRFLRITVDAQKICPAGHPGAGQPAWLFMDEIQVLTTHVQR